MNRIKTFISLLATATAICVNQSAFAIETFEPDSVMPAADTVAVINDPLHVTITDNGGATTIEVNGTKNDPDYHFNYNINADTTSEASISLALPFVGNKLSHRATSQITLFSNIYFGVLMPYNAPEAIRTSWEYGIDVVGKCYNYRGASFGIAVGIGGKEFIIRRGHTITCMDDKLTLLPAPEGATDVRTHLSMGSIRIPIYYRQRIHRSLAFRVSATLNYNFLMRGTTNYMLDNMEYSQKISGLHQRAITPEFAFAIGTLDFGGVYVKWSPVSLFKSAYGPRLSTYSIGLTLSF